MNYFTKNPERAARMESWSGIIKDFQDGLTGMPEEDKMRLPGKLMYQNDIHASDCTMSRD